ncbi:MAG: hypothetical protein QNJ72_14695 [Pleurocapsa sp. MO_226.B13]|nr:hypothetical protein [Pleurocapsa sp. MO_226.B13]
MRIIKSAIAGGISGSSILALYFVPAVYLIIKRGEKKRSEKEPELTEEKHTYQEV